MFDQMPIIVSFNSSTVRNGSYLKNIPQQITPSHMGVPAWVGRNLSKTLYHTPFSFRPFDQSKLGKTIEAIGKMNKFMLGNRIKDVCIHLSQYRMSDEDMIKSIDTCLSYFDNSIVLHFEIVPPCMSSGKTKDDAFHEADIILNHYSDNDRVKYILDTAHAYAYNMSILEMSKLVLKMGAKAEYIHFNGNQRPPFKSDAHTRFFDYNLNLIHGMPTFITNIMSNSTRNYVFICEVTDACGPAVSYDVWKEQVEQFDGCSIVEYNNSLTL